MRGMIPGRVAIATAVGIIGLAAAVPIYVGTRGGEEEEVVSQVEIEPSVSPFPLVTCAEVKPVDCSADEGLSDEERMALYQRLREEGDNLYREWLATINVDALDLHSLPRGEMPASYVNGELSLAAAVTKADLIIAGTISEIRPTPFSGIDTTVNVEQTLKGFPGPKVVISQAGRLQPTQDRSGIEIVEAANGRMLLPGDRAVLFLQKTEVGGESSAEYYIQSYSGWYQVVNGEVQPNGFSAFAGSVGGKTESEFIGVVTATVSEAAAISP